ncbi:MAG: XdhC family protein [Phaeodactylibacter sp.]|nr:XdhC family protein [Phaeodactylibacter sp.]MCB9300023.1 XdhC family protein [Lewinellaceae bacterium]HQU57713.1 XdhC family protein [Saprospiraceae bacterium]
MKDLLANIENWAHHNQPFALATVIQTWGSSPRPVGSAMIVSKEMELAGSVSGGCVEGAVIREAIPLIEQGVSKRLAFGVADEDAWAVGLSCGGKMQVFLERFLAFDERTEERAAWEKLRHCLQHNEPCILLTRLQDGPGHHTLVLPDGSSQGQAAGPQLLAAALQAYGERRHQVAEVEGDPYFIQIFPRRSRMIIIGAAHITVDLVQLASLYDFETIVIDPRGVFANKTQFTAPPDQLFVQYPAEVLPGFELDAYTYAVILSHDPKIDDNALHLLLPSQVAYIGALGSKKTQAKRVARLQAAGFSEQAISRIHAPIGLDINAKTPREIAMSVMGEIIKVKNAYL